MLRAGPLNPSRCRSDFGAVLAPAFYLSELGQVLFAWFVVRRHRLLTTARSRRPWLQAGRTLLAVVESGVFVLAFSHLPLADVHALAATSPLIVIALGTLLLGERTDPARWLARTT